MLGLADLILGILGVDYNSQKTTIYNMTREQLMEVDQSWIDATVNYRLECDGYIISAARGISGKGDTIDLIANLGAFFKKAAFTYNTKTNDDGTEEITGWRASKISVTGALLYAIFVFQSCIYFLTYVKRLFYIIMLSMFGPLVVIYDFFLKSAQG